MKTNLIIPTMFLVVTVLSVILGNNFVENWKSFLIGALFALSARDVESEIFRRLERRHPRRVR